MPRWTVNVGDEDVIVIETAADDEVFIDIPSRRPVRADRRTVEDLRLKLGAAIGDPDKGASS